MLKIRELFLVCLIVLLTAGFLAAQEKIQDMSVVLYDKQGDIVAQGTFSDSDINLTKDQNYYNFCGIIPKVNNVSDVEYSTLYPSASPERMSAITKW